MPLLLFRWLLSPLLADSLAIDFKDLSAGLLSAEYNKCEKSARKNVKLHVGS